MDFPKELIVGFQNRKDTYTKKLGFINYRYDNGELRQKTSFNKWCDESLGFEEISNKPIQGFVINKGVTRGGNFRNAYSGVRVFDPRGFEFEISFDNFLEMLTTVNVIAQEITEPCVYAWENGNVILVPINSDLYEKRIKNISMEVFNQKEDLKEGFYYSSKKYNKLVFVANKDKKNYFFDTEKRNFLDVNKKILISKSNEICDEIHELKEYFNCFSEINNYDTVSLKEHDKNIVKKFIEEKICIEEQKLSEKSAEINKNNLNYEMQEFRLFLGNIIINTGGDTLQKILGRFKSTYQEKTLEDMKFKLVELKKYVQNENFDIYLKISNESCGMYLLVKYYLKRFEYFKVPEASYKEFINNMKKFSDLTLKDYERLIKGEDIFVKCDS